MNCPICGAAMELGGVKALNIGGLISARTTLTWYPQAELEKSGFRGLLRAGGKRLVTVDGMESSTVAQGWHCAHCGQVLALFPTED